LKKPSGGPDAAPSSEYPLVWIIVLNWNGYEDSHRCLTSLEKVNYPSFKVLLVDNGSEDGSGKRLEEEFPGVDFLPLDKNYLYAGGNNAGIEVALEAGADYILLLNNDTIVTPDFLAPLVDCAIRHPEAAAVGPKIYHADRPELIWYGGGRISFIKGRLNHEELRKKDSPRSSAERRTGWVTGCALFVRAETFREVGLLDVSYGMFTEDVDWCWRATLAGYTCRFAPASRIYHAVSASTGGGLTRFKVYHRIRSTSLFFRRYASWFHWITIPFFVIGGAVRLALWEAAKGNAGIIGSLWKGLRDAFLHRLGRSA